MNGRSHAGRKIRFLRGGTTHEVMEVGQFVPIASGLELRAGQVGYLICNIKSLGDVHIGDTVSVPAPTRPPCCPATRAGADGLLRALPATVRTSKELRDALRNCRSTIPSFEFEPETSDALGFGFRCGFLGCCTWRSSSSGWNERRCRSGADRSQRDLRNHHDQAGRRARDSSPPTGSARRRGDRRVPAADRPRQLHRLPTESDRRQS
jgi:hypothetical protein